MASVNGKRAVKNLLEKGKAEIGYYGLPDIKANTDKLLEKIFSGSEYTDADRAKIVAFFSSQDIKVLGEYPRKVAQLPCIVLYRTRDGEVPRGIIGDELGESEQLYKGSMFSEAIKLEIWVGDRGGPDLRDDLYLIVRELFLRGRTYLGQTCKMIAPEWTEGQDGMLYDPERAPHIVHKAMATIPYKQVTTWEENGPQAMTQLDHRLKDHGGLVNAQEYEETADGRFVVVDEFEGF